MWKIISCSTLWFCEGILGEFTLKQGKNDSNDKRNCEPEMERDHPAFLILYSLVCAYCFLGIAITCHDYFITAMTKICKELKLSEDVVGATFMAAGSSAPELATVVITVFFSKNDLGISDVVGSAVFNMLFVVALCGLGAKNAMTLNWWPLLRNCFFYTGSIALMLLAIYDGKVSWFESAFLIGGYALYCLALYYNEFLEAFANTLPLPFQPAGSATPVEPETDYIALEERSPPVPNERTSIVQANGVVVTKKQLDQASHVANHEPDPLAYPSNGSAQEVVKWLGTYPIRIACKWTIPDWSASPERVDNLYLATFFVSLVWISFYSYIMIRMISLIGFIMRIPDTIMGLTFVAAGVSVPDAITSFNVARHGHGDMALSNAIGSNIFDILICLGVPWFLKTAVIIPGSYVFVFSKGMIYITMFLLSTVVLLVGTTHYNEWKLDKQLGLKLMVGYVVFLTVAVVDEIFDSTGRC